MGFKFSFKLVSFVLLMSMFNGLLAEKPLGEDGTIDHDFKAKKWQEQNVVIPAMPKKKNLVRLKFPHPMRKYYIDLKSISVGKKDRVARYTVIVESNSGVQNVFYEAIRCHQKDYKTYAYSIGGQGFRKMSTVVWREIKGTGVHKYRQVLYDHYVCHNSVVRYKAKDIVKVLKYPPDSQEP